MSDLELNLRLNILESSGQIGKQARSLTEKLINQIEAEFDVILNEENAAPIVTHVAKALERLVRGEEISLDLLTLGEELLEFPTQVNFSNRFFETIGNELLVEVPPAEIQFLAAHLSVITMQR